jgi:hypothetical protein
VSVQKSRHVHCDLVEVIVPQLEQGRRAICAGDAVQRILHPPQRQEGERRDFQPEVLAQAHARHRSFGDREGRAGGHSCRHAHTQERHTIPGNTCILLTQTLLKPPPTKRMGFTSIATIWASANSPR